MTLEKQVELLQQHVMQLNEMVLTQQRMMLEGKTNYSGSTTAY